MAANTHDHGYEKARKKGLCSYGRKSASPSDHRLQTPEQ